MYALSVVKSIGFNAFRVISHKCWSSANVLPINSLLIKNEVILHRIFSSLATNDIPTETSNCNIGTIGHIDHGKTTLTSAITKILEKDGLAKYLAYDSIDSTREEKVRGITVNATHVGYRTLKRHYAHTDCPGHADYIRNMISGTSQMDGAIVVVSAADGPMPQTKEHLILAKQIGVNKVVIFINKADIVDEEIVELTEIEIREMLSSYGFDGINTPVVIGSALLALNGDTSKYGEPCIRELLRVIDEYIDTPVRDLDSPFLIPIDNSFTITGRGSVIIGTLKQGTIKKNDVAQLMGYDRVIKTSISEIHIFKQKVKQAEAGDNVGILVRGIRIKEIERGMVLVAANSMQLSNMYNAEFYLLPTSEGGRKKPIKAKCYVQQLFSETWDIACRIDLKDREMLLPGEHASVVITLLRGMLLLPGQTFTFRENNVLVGTGKITSALPPKILSKTGLNYGMEKKEK